jgi:hypothetical protein
MVDLSKVVCKRLPEGNTDGITSMVFPDGTDLFKGFTWYFTDDITDLFREIPSYNPNLG